MTIDRTAALADDLKEAKNPNEFWQRCLKSFEDLGVSGIGYGVTPMVDQAFNGSVTKATFFSHTYPLEWERAIGKDRLLDEDITVELMLKGAEEINWNTDPTVFGGTQVNKELFELENDLGLVWGKTLLLSHHSRDRVSSGIGLQITSVKSHDELDRFWAEYGADIRAVGEMLDAGMLGRHKDGVVRLTGREKDYLYWSAMGLDRIETAHRLGISENTLDKPIASAKAKLKARNTSQAVAKAVLLGLIDL